ncbi:histidine kinase/DNA gyrase B/HSP90-like ATPase [Mumia flava]|uniref:histidine kinase n=1 Tax=Mumia flava TaxID=1348852 RepID=A0A0B2BF55_9ACTN|nr:ATP-binding protein [Mumia flava]PJJ57416.1 histidine kinase/DNA gyrase B/HSP90-like ATPase [Mumia flava]
MSTPERLPCDIDELRRMFLFEKLDDDQLVWLCEHGHVERADLGWLIREGDDATCFYVLLEGEIALYRAVGGDDVEVSRTDQPGVYTGAWSAYLGDRVPQTYGGSTRVLTPSRFFVLSADDFATLMRDWFPMAVHLLEGLFFGQRNTQAAVGQRERLLALGSLSAGLTHELNNPAAAAVRATASLRERVSAMRHKLALIAEGPYDRETLGTLILLQDEALKRRSEAIEADALGVLESSDLEDRVTDWLDDHGVEQGWEVAPLLVAGGLDEGWLDKVAKKVTPDVVPGAVRWLAYTLETEQLMSEIEDATARVSTLVDAAKQYSQLDRAPFAPTDVHELLDATLVMLQKKTGEVRVVKAYDRSIAPVPMYAAEMNQVWTNLIVNALQAMHGQGTLTLTTRRVEDWAEVEVADTGPGIDPGIRDRIFEPFFTTKAVGEGTGLGLDISWRIVVRKHHGDLQVTSEPGDTRFTVRLPYDPPPVPGAEG